MVSIRNILINSIMKYFFTINPVKTYFGVVEENMEVPCMYFLIPQYESIRASLSTDVAKYEMGVEIHDKSVTDALDKAERIVEAIAKNRNMIPIYNEDGTQSDNYIRIDKTSYKQNEKGIIEINIAWKCKYSFPAKEYEKIKKLNIDEKIPISLKS